MADDLPPVDFTPVLASITVREKILKDKLEQATAQINKLTEAMAVLKNQNEQLTTERDFFRKEVTALKSKERNSSLKSPPIARGSHFSSTPKCAFKPDSMIQPRITPSIFKVPVTIDLCSAKKGTTSTTPPTKKETHGREEEVVGTTDESLATTVDPGDSITERQNLVRELSGNDSLASTVDDSDEDVAETQKDVDSPPTAAAFNKQASKELDNCENNLNVAANGANLKPTCMHNGHEHHHHNVDPSPVIPSKCRPPVKPCHDDSYDLLPAWREQAARQPCVEVVRRKADRRQYHGIDCAECREYYAAVGGEHREISSRHRSNQLLPQTPEGFWNLSWREDNQKPSTSNNIDTEVKEKEPERRVGQKSVAKEDIGKTDFLMKRRRQPFKPTTDVAKLRQTVRLSQSP